MFFNMRRFVQFGFMCKELFEALYYEVHRYSKHYIMKQKIVNFVSPKKWKSLAFISNLYFIQKTDTLVFVIAKGLKRLFPVSVQSSLV